MPSLFTAALWIVLEDMADSARARMAAAFHKAELRPIDLVWTALTVPFAWLLVSGVFAVTP